MLFEFALAGIREACEQRGLGSIESWRTFDDASGTSLGIQLVSALHGGRRVRYGRVVLPARGADKDAETAGMIYSVGLVERLRTRSGTVTHHPDGDYLAF